MKLKNQLIEISQETNARRMEAEEESKTIARNHFIGDLTDLLITNAKNGLREMIYSNGATPFEDGIIEYIKIQFEDLIVRENVLQDDDDEDVIFQLIFTW